MDNFSSHTNRLEAPVPPRPVIAAPKFGQWLQLQRGTRSLEQIAIRVRPFVKPTGLKVDQSLIYKLEQGRVPSWPLLGALCRVYDVDIRDGALILIGALQFPGVSDLIGQTSGVGSPSHPASGS